MAAVGDDMDPMRFEFPIKKMAAVGDDMDPTTFLKNEMQRFRNNFFHHREHYSLEFRKQQLLKIKEAFLENESELLGAVQADLGGTRFSTWTCHYQCILTHIDDFVYNLDAWAAPVSIDSPILFAPMKSYLEYQPIGVVCVYGCWNFPLVLTMEPLIAAIAAGNCVMTKITEVTTNTEKVLARVLRGCLDERFYGIYTGGPEVSRVFPSLSFDKILFTGGTETGRKIATAAGPNITPLVLELGGKNPTIVDESCDVATAAAKIMWARNYNSGQICMCPDYVIVHSKVKEEFLECCKKEITKQWGFTMEEQLNGEMGHMINIAGVQRFKQIVTDDHGGKLICGGQWNEENLYCAPTIIDEPRYDSLPMTLEGFCPILAVITIDDIEEIIKFISHRDQPLALYYFGATRNNKRLDMIKHLTSSGSFVANDCLVQYFNHHLPFGGVGKSGLGNYGGVWGFKTFSHAKPVVYKPASDHFCLMNPPYKNTESILTLSMKNFGNWTQQDGIIASLKICVAVGVSAAVYMAVNYDVSTCMEDEQFSFGCTWFQ